MTGCVLSVLDKEMIIGKEMIKYNHVLYFLEEIELARFKLQEGSKLRTEYTGFFDSLR